MASISPSNTSPSLRPSWSSDTNSNALLVRDASFSSYLNTSEENYILTLVEASQNLNTHQVISKHQLDHQPYNSRQKKVEDGEIDVFSADKYFNGGIEKHSSRSRSVKHHRNDDSEKVKPRAPASHSGSSWNGQSALLKPLHRTPSRSSDNGSKGHHGKRSFFSCCCCDKVSVDVDHELINSKSPLRTCAPELRGTLPLEIGVKNVLLDAPDNLSPGHGRGVITRTIKTNLEAAEITQMNKLNKVHYGDDDQEKRITRKSLEVFGSSEGDDLDGSKRFSLDKRLNMLTWDAIIPISTTDEEVNTTEAPSDTQKDTESDASSDLFELECLSCTNNPVNQGTQHPPEGSNSSAPMTNEYAPSEASIEWSVVTASPPRMASKSGSSAKKLMNKEKTKAGSGVLSGCKSQKSVRVAGEVCAKFEGQKMHRYSDSFTPISRFQAKAKVVAGFGHRQRSISSDLLYIH